SNLKHLHFRQVLLFLFLNSILVTHHFVEGIFTTKEIALYITSGYSFIVLGFYFLCRDLPSLSLNWIDIFSIGLLVIIPLLQFGFSNEVTLAIVFQQGAFGCIYLTIRLIAASMPKP